MISFTGIIPPVRYASDRLNFAGTCELTIKYRSVKGVQIKNLIYGCFVNGAIKKRPPN